MDLSALVNMLIICWVPALQMQSYTVVKEAWRIEKSVPLGQCLTMNRVFTTGGAQGVVTVRCGDGYKVSPQK